MARGNFEHNYPIVKKYLDDNSIEYIEYNDGQHLKIMGDTAYVELWPSRMTVHVIESEKVYKQDYFRLSFNAKTKELDELLKGA